MTYGFQIIINEAVKPNEPFEPHQELALSIYHKALKEAQTQIQEELMSMPNKPKQAPGSSKPSQTPPPKK